MRFSVFGDSICVGQYVSTHETWVTEMARQVNSLGKTAVLVQNAGVNGNTTRLALERLSYDVLSHKPDVVYVQFGMNDANTWATDFGEPRVSKKSFESNIIEIVNKVIASGAKLVFIATNHPSNRRLSDGTLDSRYNAANKQYNEITRSAFQLLIEDFNNARIELIDNELHWMKQGIAAHPQIADFLLDDGVHLSQKGHNEYIKCTVPVIVESLRLLIAK